MSPLSKIMRRIMLVTLPLWGSILACGLFSAAPTPTPVPTPTSAPTSLPPVATLPPLPTLAPTSTPRPADTATPDYQATQEILQGQAFEALLTKLGLPTGSGSLTWFQTKPVDIALEGPSDRFYQLDEIPAVSDFVLSTQVTWTTDGWPVCGIMFRTNDKWDMGDFYFAQFLRVSGLPAWDIEYYKNGKQAGIPTEEVRYSSFLKLQSGAKNDIVFSAVGNEFKMYINGNFEGRYYDYDSRLSEGSFAFRAWQDSGNTTCTFDQTKLWVYK